MRKQNLVRLLWVLLLGCVVSGSLLPSGSEPMRILDVLKVNDKVLHFLAYTALMLLPAVCERRRIVILLAVAIESLGVVLEFAQLWVPGRSCDLRDVAANTAGVIAGLVAAWFLRPRLDAFAGWRGQDIPDAT